MTSPIGGTAFSAVNARCILGYGSGTQTPFTANRWSVNFKADEHDVTNFESQRFYEPIGGLWEADFTVDGYYNGTYKPYAFFYILPGFNISYALALYISSQAVGTVKSTDFWLFPKWFCSSSMVDASVRDYVKFNFAGKNDQIFYPPGLTANMNVINVISAPNVIA